MAILVGLSSLPFFHELIINENGVVASWVPDLNIENFLKDENNKVLGYSKYRVFLYYLLAEIYILIAWLGWYSVAKTKPYRNALLLGAISTAYHLFLILSNNRKTDLNNYDLKLTWTIGIALVLFVLYYYSEKKKKRKLQAAHATFGTSPKKIITAKVVLAWLAIIGASTLIYFHDIVTLRGTGVKDWVPNFGIEEFVTLGEKNVWGFNSYRVLILTLCIQLFGQIPWAGWFMDADYKLYKPFLLVPLGLSFHQLIMTISIKSDTYLNKPDFKLVMILAFGVFVGVLYYFKNKGLPKHIKSISSSVPQNSQINQNLK